jgi:hypothetical protein
MIQITIVIDPEQLALGMCRTGKCLLDYGNESVNERVFQY